ncbi:MAG: hypothetical protein HW380_384 [Magnetococcales bacterium]|nr:hypothetical protein [Magnetococcales bacterium]HIJ83905.1 flagellar biosynthetic protein FliO [Magnetococcales bacterium]
MKRKDCSATWTWGVPLAVMFPVTPGWTEGIDPELDLWAKGVEVSGYLLIFIVLAALAVHLAKRYRPHWAASGPIHVVDGRTLGPGVGIRLVRIGSRAWLLGITRERISLLAELNAAELSATASAHPMPLSPQNLAGVEP